MMKMFARSMDDYYSQLKGMQIIHTFMLDLGEFYSDKFPCLVLQDIAGNIYHMIVSRDPEQNGPGFLHWDMIE